MEEKVEKQSYKDQGSITLFQHARALKYLQKQNHADISFTGTSQDIMGQIIYTFINL